MRIKGTKAVWKIEQSVTWTNWTWHELEDQIYNTEYWTVIFWQSAFDHFKTPIPNRELFRSLAGAVNGTLQFTQFFVRNFLYAILITIKENLRNKSFEFPDFPDSTLLQPCFRIFTNNLYFSSLIQDQSRECPKYGWFSDEKGEFSCLLSV